MKIFLHYGEFYLVFLSHRSDPPELTPVENPIGIHSLFSGKDIDDHISYSHYMEGGDLSSSTRDSVTESTHSLWGTLRPLPFYTIPRGGIVTMDSYMIPSFL